MEPFEVYAFNNGNPSYLRAIQGEIDMDPVYQRQGQVWSTAKKQLLIDSMINGFDLPKIYLHKYSEPQKKEGRRINYAVVDGKQRLEAIFDFMGNRFALAGDFKLFRDPDVDISGSTFADLTETHPRLIAKFLAAVLPIFIIKTVDVEFIEEMFSRLNEAVPLNAPEKRNAFGGPAPRATRELAQHPFFAEKLPFTNSRYRHFDLAAKFLLWEDDWAHGNEDKVKDVKKRQLDDFFKELHVAADGDERVDLARDNAVVRLDELFNVFTDSDRLLQSVGLVSVYYILMQDRNLEGEPFPSRVDLERFEDQRRQDLAVDDEEFTRGHIALLEFNRLAQSPNDNGALVYRFSLLDDYTRALRNGTDPLDAIAQHAPEQREKD